MAIKKGEKWVDYLLERKRKADCDFTELKKCRLQRGSLQRTENLLKDDKS
jgi:hypothetical protein